MSETRRGTFCGSPDHALNRRGFLGTVAAGAAAFAADMTVLDVLKSPVLAGELKRNDKRVILLWLAGGSSQLETWDPKPGTPTGGPFRSIPTAVPGIHISELMPKMAQRMDQTCIIRSLNTKNGDHGGGARLMMHGRRDDASVRYPDLGAVLARELGQAHSQVPDYVSFYSATEGRRMAPGSSGFLGERYAPMHLTTGMIPENLRRLDEISELDHVQRAELRDLMSKQFERGRSSRVLGSHNVAYERVRGLMASESLFDISREPQKVRDQFGPTQFGEQALVARRLVEAGVPFVRVARAWWDSHGQNFETHQEMVPELDHVMAALLDDLKAARAARKHAGDHARRVRPHAGDQPEPGPRPLRHRLERHPLRRRHPRRLGLRQDRRERPGRRRRPGRSRRAVRHHLPGTRHRPPETVHGRRSPRPPDRNRHRTDP